MLSLRLNWPCGPRIPALALTPKFARPLSKVMSGKPPNSRLVTPVLTLYPVGYGSEGSLPTSAGSESPSAPAHPARSSFTHVDVGVQVQPPLISRVLLIPCVLQ